MKKEDIIVDKNYLTSETSINEYFVDNGYDYFDCGQGYYQEEADLIVRIEDDFFKVYLRAEIGSQKQDRGDRLYFVENVEVVKYHPVHRKVVEEEITNALVAAVDKANLVCQKANEDLISFMRKGLE